jgi:branched-chain amino acid transport system ATP-binding protein
MEYMLEIKKLEAFYGKLQILKGISLSIAKGKIVCLLGGNGSGKSTTLKSIIGMVPPARGKIVFDGQKINGFPTNRIIKAGISMIPQGREIFPKLSVLENLKIGAFVRKDYNEIEKDIDKMLQLFPTLYENRYRLAGNLSGGQQQMLAVSRGLMSKPKLLLMDEPSAGFAPVVVKEVYNVINLLKEKGLTILLVEHNVNAALSAGDYAYILTNGIIEFSDKCKNLMNNPDLKSAYLGG